MPNQPLQPFAPPNILLQHIPSGVIYPGFIVEWFLYIVFAFWLVYTVIAIYHWLKYSHGSWVAFPAIALHIFVSLALMTYALTGAASYVTSYIP